MNVFSMLLMFLGCNLLQFHLDAMNEEQKNEVIQNITKRNLVSVKSYGSIFNVILEGQEPDSDVSLHLYRHNRNGICYFAPLFEPFEETPLERIRDQYLIFNAAVGREPQSCVAEAIANGAEILGKVDSRFNPIVLAFQKENGSLCTWDDIRAGRVKRLTQPAQPFYGTNTYGWSALACALSRGKVKVAQEIFTQTLPLLPKEEQEKSLFLDNLDKTYEKDSEQLLLAQQNAEIPTFFLEKTCDSFKDITHNEYDNHTILSADDSNLKIMALITTNDVKIGCMTSMNTWKQQALDLDALATLYAVIICYNDKKGKRIVNLFEHWQKIDSFRTQVINYISENLENQMYAPRKLVPENIVLFADKALNVIPKKGILHECLAIALRCFGSKLEDPIFNKQHDDLLNVMLGHPETKEVLKALCNEEPALFKQTVKPKLQHTLLCNWLVRILQQSLPLEKTKEMPLKHLPKSLIDHIVSFWHPDEKFKQGFLR